MLNDAKTAVSSYRQDEVRRIFSEFVNLGKMYGCTACDRHIELEYLYCPWCGTQNRQFSEQAFCRMYGTNDITMVQEEHCPEEHATHALAVRKELGFFLHELRSLHDEPMRAPDSLLKIALFCHCTLCGKDCTPHE